MSRKLSTLFILSGLVVFVFSSCNRKIESLPQTLENTYFPTQVGKHYIYDVDSTIYDDFLQLTFVRNCQLIYNVMDTFYDNEGRLSYTYTIQYRKNDNDTWKANDVIYVTPTASGIEVVQNNLRFKKLAYPLELEFTWKGNSYIPAGDQDYTYYQDWDYTYTSISQPFTGKYLNFQRAISVEETDYHLNNPDVLPDVYAEKTSSSAVYALGVGMVYKEFTRWIYDPSVVQYRNGVSVEMHLLSHN